MECRQCIIRRASHLTTKEYLTIVLPCFDADSIITMSFDLQQSPDRDCWLEIHTWVKRYIKNGVPPTLGRKTKKNSCSNELMIGIAEGGARTHDLEVDLFAVIRATRSTNWATPARVLLMVRVWWCCSCTFAARVGLFPDFFPLRTG